MLFFIIWIVCMPLGIWVILQIVSKRRADTAADPDVQLEECAICHEEFPMDALIEKEIGGYSRVYCFCGGCIEQLRLDYQAKVGHRDEQDKHISESVNS